MEAMMESAMGLSETEQQGEGFGEVASLLTSPDSRLLRREPLAPRTTFRVGGPADWFAVAGSEADLQLLVTRAATDRLPMLLIGRGSNLLVRDGGVRGLVISLDSPAFGFRRVDGARLYCGAGARLSRVSRTACEHSLGGLEFLEGIPGNVGGGLRMNAGAMGTEMSVVTQSIRLMDFLGEIREGTPESLGMSYRRCSGLESAIALSATLTGKIDDPAAIQHRMRKYSEKRWASQPPAKCAGCAFKNPPDIPAGRLIDELGLKGTRVGNASVSELHGNFIINEGKATAQDVLTLIEQVQQKVEEAHGIRLECEVRVVGED